MEKEIIIDRLSARRKGTCVRIIVDRPAEVYQKWTEQAGVIRKRSAYSLQLANYGNRAPVKAAVEAGERAAPELPKWVDRAEDIGNGLRFWHGKTGQIYLALPVFGEKDAAKVQWTRDGKKVKRSEIDGFLTANERRTAQRDAPGQVAFNAIKLENIASLR